MGMNISDVVKLTPPGVVEKESIAEAQEKLAELKAFDRIARDYSPRRSRDGEIAGVVGKIAAEINQLRMRMLTASGSVADLVNDPLTEAEDNIGLVAESPKVALPDLRALCDTLGFVIVPSAYLRKEAVASESRDMVRAIERFAALAPFQSYVMCPVDYYDVSAHVRSEEDLPIYGGRSSQAFVALSMSVPAMRGIVQDIAHLGKRVDGIDKRVKTAEGNIESLANSVRALQRSVADQQRELTLARASEADLARKVAKLERSAFVHRDPMALALPPNADINGDAGWAAIGPVWGPDVEDIVMTALGLNRIKGQRKLLEAARDRFAPVRSRPTTTTTPTVNWPWASNPIGAEHIYHPHCPCPWCRAQSRI